MDILATYIIILFACLYSMATTADDRTFLFWMLVLCILVPMWVRVCMRWGDGKWED